jgi:hypothetical protein
VSLFASQSNVAWLRWLQLYLEGLRLGLRNKKLTSMAMNRLRLYLEGLRYQRERRMAIALNYDLLAAAAKTKDQRPLRKDEGSVTTPARRRWTGAIRLRLGRLRGEPDRIQSGRVVSAAHVAVTMEGEAAGSAPTFPVRRRGPGG